MEDRTGPVDMDGPHSAKPAEARARLAQERHDQTRDALYREEGVQELMKEFGATMNESSIQSKNEA